MHRSLRRVSVLWPKEFLFSSTDVVRSSAKPVKFWTAVRRGLLAQTEMSESLSSDLVPVLAHGDVGPLRRPGLSADADMLARVLAQIRPSSRTEWLESIHQTMEANNSLTRRCGYSPFQIAIGRDPELPGDLLQDLPNDISSCSILHDDLAAHTVRIRSNARLAVMPFNDNLATRRALDQRLRPLRECSVGDEVAVWRRGNGQGAPGKQRRAQWRGPGIILGAVRGNYFVAMPWSVIKAAREKLRHRTA